MINTYTDDQIAAMDNVSPIIAGKYLGQTPEVIRRGLIRKEFPFGTAVKLRRYVYCIPGPALVRYKHYGNEGAEMQRGGKSQ